MGTLPIMPLLQNMWLLRKFLPLVVVIMLGMQAGKSSGDVNLARPYLFRDYDMPAGYAQPIAHLYQQKPPQDEHRQQQEQQPQSTESIEYDDAMGSSEEDQAQYTAPLILDIDDPEVKARWLGLRDQSYEDDEDEELEDDDDFSLSSSEFRPRNLPASSSSDAKKAEARSDVQDSDADKSEETPPGESRGILDNFKITNNPLMNFWGGGESDVPEYDEGPDFYNQPYVYDPNSDSMYEQKKPKPPGMPKPKPKPMMKPKPKQKPKQKRKPKPPPLRLKKKQPQYSSQFHYQQHPKKPGKLQVISDKLAKLNPLRYVSFGSNKERKSKPPQNKEHPQNDESKNEDQSSPEFVMIFGEPFGDFSEGQLKDIEGEGDDNDNAQNDDEMDEGDDEEDGEDEEEDEEEDDEQDDDDDNEPVTIIENPSADSESGVVEDDSAEASPSGEFLQSQSETSSTDPREKSFINGKIVKYFGVSKKPKHHRRRRRPRRPARRPPHWKDYEAAPLIPEVFGDTLLKIVKNVGILPEYAKDEKYGGHHKIKGKFTKTRPITFHHGAFTEVLRRR